MVLSPLSRRGNWYREAMNHVITKWQLQKRASRLFMPWLGHHGKKKGSRRKKRGHFKILFVHSRKTLKTYLFKKYFWVADILTWFQYKSVAEVREVMLLPQSLSVTPGTITVISCGLFQNFHLAFQGCFMQQIKGLIFTFLFLLT